MKTTVILLLLSVSVFAQPNKGGIDSAALKNDSLFTWAKGVKTFRGDVSPSLRPDQYRTLVYGYGSQSFNAVGSFGYGPNIKMYGHNSVAIGQNLIMYANGASSRGADNITYPTANYSDVAGDGNEVFGTASSTDGFGNDNYDENGRVEGMSNILGTTPNQYRSSYLGGERNKKLSGDRTYGFGRVLNQSGNDNHTFGTGVDGTLTPLVSNEPSSFNVGFNSTVPTFTVSRANGPGTYGITHIRGKVSINGVLYNFPSVQGSPGSVLVNDGFGNLSWSAPVTQNLQQPKGLAVFNSMGQLLYIKSVY